MSQFLTENLIAGNKTQIGILIDVAIVVRAISILIDHRHPRPQACRDLPEVLGSDGPIEGHVGE